MPSICIVDYGLGNLFSVQRALERVGASDAFISDQKSDIQNADRLILPGVGAFKDGMRKLHSLGLVSVIQEYAATGKPVLGVCLGMQLLMSNSEEFGLHDGLDLLSGKVRQLAPGQDRRFKVPHIGWNSLHGSFGGSDNEQQWQGTILKDVSAGSFMYFVHSFVVEPDDQEIVTALTQYGQDEYCSVLNSGNITGAQFHPELSGEDGLSLYRNFVFDE